MRLLVCALIASLLPMSALAFERITSAHDFATQISGRALTRIGVSLTVLPSGQIEGRGMGSPVTGAWQWSEGYFCRTLAWGDRALGHNCQAVLLEGDRVRFVSDRGTGDHADFRLH